MKPLVPKLKHNMKIPDEADWEKVVKLKKNPLHQTRKKQKKSMPS
jgi:hypothetical protein